MSTRNYPAKAKTQLVNENQHNIDVMVVVPKREGAGTESLGGGSAPKRAGATDGSSVAFNAQRQMGNRMGQKPLLIVRNLGLWPIVA